MSQGSDMPKITCSLQTIADEFERWMGVADCDGFNMVPAIQPHGIRDFTELVVPECQRRGPRATVPQAILLNND